MFKDKNYELYSFDVFDTLVTRTTYNPFGIFLLMQNELLFNKEYSDIPDFVRHNFKVLRTGAENFLNRTRFFSKTGMFISPAEAQQEFSPEEFYSLMGKQHNLTSEQQERLINLEIETEIKNSVPIKKNIELLKELISKGKRVVLISDMYLTENVIRKILSQHDTIFNDIKIYVSSKCHERKSTGKLYHIVAKEENILDYSKWLHIGDNENGDIKAAKKLKINTYHYKKEEKTEFEENFYTESFLSVSPEAQVLLASNIQTRQFLKDNPITDFATLATTVLYPYVKYIINKSLEIGLTRLYFIARDGYVLKEMADIIIEQDKIKNLSTYYLYGSRAVWRMPCVRKFEDISFTFNHYIGRSTISHIANDLKIKTSELQKFLKHNYKDENKILTLNDLRSIKNILNNQEFFDFILNKNREKKELLLEYLKQNMDFSDDKFAFIDLTGSGLTNYMLSNLIKDNFNVTSNNFAISLYGNYQDSAIRFYDFIQQNYVALIVEIFGRAPHGQTIGYKNIEGKIEPILAKTEKFDNFKKYIDAVKFQTKLLNHAANINVGLNLYDFSFMLTNSIKDNYTHDIAKYFSSVDFSAIGTNKSFSISKNKLNFLDLLNIFYFKKTNPEKKQIDFALKNSNILIRGLGYLFKRNPKFNLPKLKHNFRHTSILIKSKF